MPTLNRIVQKKKIDIFQSSFLTRISSVFSE